MPTSPPPELSWTRRSRARRLHNSVIPVNPVVPATATGDTYCLIISPATAAAAFTASQITGIQISNPTKGAGSSLTWSVGMTIAAQTSGSYADIGLRIATPSGGSTENKALVLGYEGNPTSSNAGIWFGSDTVLYRSAPSVVTANAGFQCGHTVAPTRIGRIATDLVGFYAATPIVRPSGTPAAATDPATTMALANSLRASLIAVGLVA